MADNWSAEVAERLPHESDCQYLCPGMDFSCVCARGAALAHIAALEKRVGDLEKDSALAARDTMLICDALRAENARLAKRVEELECVGGNCARCGKLDCLPVCAECSTTIRDEIITEQRAENTRLERQLAEAKAASPADLRAAGWDIALETQPDPGAGATTWLVIERGDARHEVWGANDMDSLEHARNLAGLPSMLTATQPASVESEHAEVGRLIAEIRAAGWRVGCHNLRHGLEWYASRPLTADADSSITDHRASGMGATDAEALEALRAKLGMPSQIAEGGNG